MNRFTFNKARLTKDVEIQTTTSGVKIANINIAVTRDRKNNNGEYDSDFFKLKAFNKLAETVSVYCHKGDMMMFEGTIQNNSYEKEGQKHYINEFLVNKIEFLSKAQKENKPSIEVNEQVEKDPYEEMGDEVQLSADDLPFDF